VEVNARYKHQLTALMWAAASGSLPTVELLLQRGADAQARDDRGKTALDIATDERQAEIVRRLSAASGNQGASAGP
jgi:ankyrin repeat protein